MISVRIPEEVYSAYEEESKTRGIKISELVRLVLAPNRPTSEEITRHDFDTFNRVLTALFKGYGNKSEHSKKEALLIEIGKDIVSAVKVNADGTIERNDSGSVKVAAGSIRWELVEEYFKAGF